MEKIRILLEKYFIIVAFILLALFFVCLDTCDGVLKISSETLKNVYILKAKIYKYWEEAPYKYFMGGQVEKESLWKPKAELKTPREYGFGLAQITVTNRFNNFEEARKRYKELKHWKWEDRFNVDYQLTYLVLEDKSLFKRNYKLFIDDLNRWAGVLVSYNAGFGTVLQRRALCVKTEGCNFKQWFGGLDTVAGLKESNLLYGKKLADRRNDYPKDIIFNRSLKYKKWII